MVFVTGTDTGAGKTVLTTLLLASLRGGGVNALALKPFCSGSRGDAEALRAWEKECLTLEEVNPFYFDKPLAPLAAAPARTLPTLGQVVGYVNSVARRCEVLLIEGAGGVLVPLGSDYTVANLILALDCPAIVVARNQLGTINHTLLTVRHLQTIGVKHISVVMMGAGRPDLSTETNLRILGDLAPGIGLVELPFLGRKPLGVRQIKKSVTFLKKTLARIMNNAIVSLPARKGWV
jgi:dethiobiotin synthetase